MRSYLKQKKKAEGMRKDVIRDLKKVKEEFDTVLESIELMSDDEFMSSYARAKQQVAGREFGDWDEL